MDKFDQMISDFAEMHKISKLKIKERIIDLDLDDTTLETLMFFQDSININPFIYLVAYYPNEIKHFKTNLEAFSQFGLRNDLVILYFGLCNLAENLKLKDFFKPYIKRFDQNIDQLIKNEPKKLELVKRQMINSAKYNIQMMPEEGDYFVRIGRRIGGLCNKEVFLNIIEATAEETDRFADLEIRIDFDDIDTTKYDYHFIKKLKRKEKLRIKEILKIIMGDFENKGYEAFEILERLEDVVDEGLREAEFFDAKSKDSTISKRTEEKKLDFSKLENQLKMNLKGQNKQIDLFIKRLKVLEFGGLKDKGAKAVFLLAGPTGVGKTELAKLFSQYAELPLIRIDGSEYKESHTVSKILGSPPGYVGYYEQGNKVFDVVLANKKAVFLIDEIEKAHPEVLDVFLHIFDEGIAKDNRQMEIDFKDCIFMLTTNIGSFEATKNTIGFHDANDKQEKYQGAIEKRLKPEFINRIDEIIYFNQLKKDDVYMIIDLCVKRIEQKLAGNKYQYEIILDQAGFDFLTSKINYQKYGARDVFRVLSEEMVPHLIDISKKTKEGTIINSGDDELRVNRIEPALQKTKKKK